MSLISGKSNRVSVKTPSVASVASGSRAAGGQTYAERK